MFSHVSVCLFTLAGGGHPHPRSGWVPPPWMGKGAHWGTPYQGQVPGLDGGTGWSTPCPGLDGVPHQSRTGWGIPPLVRRQSSTAITCYVVGGMLLAFIQEDFLV